MKKRTRTIHFLIEGCIFCCILLVSCISIPGENNVSDRNLAAEYYDLGLKYTETKQYDKALQCFEKVRERIEDTAPIDYQIARVYSLSNKWKEASDIFGKLLELDENNSTLKENFAYTLYKSGEKEKALQLYEELCNKNPGNERIESNYKELYDEAYPPEPEEDGELESDSESSEKETAEADE